MKNIFAYLYLNILLFSFILNKTKIESSTIVKNSMLFHKTLLTISIEKINNNFFLLDNEVQLPSDLLTNLPLNSEFILQISQGSINDSLINNFLPFNLSNYENQISDYPVGYFYISKNFSPLDNVADFKKYFDVFSYVFKITLIPLINRANYIKYNDYKILIERKEKVCNEHLEGIKNLLIGQNINLEFKNLLDFYKFLHSDFKSIKYYVKHNKNNIEYNIEILNRYLESELEEKNNYNNKNYIFNLYTPIESNRYMEGYNFNFENFKFHHIINLKNVDLFENNLEIIEVLPTKILTPIYSSINIILYNNDNIEIANIKSNEIKNYFDVNLIEEKENTFIDVPFSYDYKISNILKLQYLNKKFYKKNKFYKIEIIIEFRKKILNFESFDNGVEFGYAFPCGLIIINDHYTITNYIYYNMPNIDVTMPFNLIAISWLIFGYMYTQILGLFLGKNKSKSLLEKLKDRFVNKWGWVWGKV